MPEPHEDLQTTVAAQHARIRELIRAVHDTTGTDRTRAFTSLTRFLAIHEAAEQLFLHGSLLRDPAEDAEVARQRVTEEQQTSQAIGLLESFGVDSFQFLTQFDLFEKAVTSHAEAEEDEELPTFIDRLLPEDIERVVRGLDMVEFWFDDDSASAAIPRKGTFTQQHEAAEAAFRAHMAS